VTPSMREASGGISTDPSRQEPATFVGIVSEPTAGGDGPERVFALTPDAGAKGENLLVWLRTSAPFFRADGKPSPALTDGIRVVVHGRLQPNTKRVLAESVAVLADGERPADTASVSGDVSDANADAGSFAVTARDLRQIESALKVITDLERIGDHAVDIAKIARKLTQEFYLKAPLLDIGPLALTAQTMLHQSLESLVRHDLELAVRVCENDDEADDAFKTLRDELLAMTQNKPSLIFPASYMLLAVVYLERIADHATNIAERVYYIETGDRKPLGRRDERPEAL